jgi:hypothetical protein
MLFSNVKSQELAEDLAKKLARELAEGIDIGGVNQGVS